MGFWVYGWLPRWIQVCALVAAAGLGLIVAVGLGRTGLAFALGMLLTSTCFVVFVLTQGLANVPWMPTWLQVVSAFVVTVGIVLLSFGLIGTGLGLALTIFALVAGGRFLRRLFNLG